MLGVAPDGTVGATTDRPHRIRKSRSRFRGTPAGGWSAASGEPSDLIELVVAALAAEPDLAERC